MIKKLHEEWDKLSPEAREAAAQDPANRPEILARLESLTTAFRKISEGSVTRVSLSQAVRTALQGILQEESAIPQVSSLREEINEVRRMVGETLADRGPSLADEVRRELTSAQELFAAGIRDLREDFQDEMEGLRAVLRSAPQVPEAASASAAGSLKALQVESAARVREVESRLDAQIVRLREELARETMRLESEFSDRLQRSAEKILGGSNGAAGRIEEQATRLAAMGQDLATADDHLAAGLKDLECRLAGTIRDVESAAAARIEGVEGRLQQNIAAAETRLGEAQGQLEAKVLSVSGDRHAEDLKGLESRLSTRIDEKEANLGARIEGVDGSLRRGITAAQERFSATQVRLEAGISGRLGEMNRMFEDLVARVLKAEEALPELRSMEVRLRTQMEINMDQISDRLNSLVDMVGQIQSVLPPRQVFEGLQNRLESMESRFHTVSDQLDGLEGAVPEMKSLGERLSALRSEVTGLSGDVATSEKELHETWNVLSLRVQEIQDLLRSSMERSNADRSNLRQRLVDLRDTLQDQIQKAIQTAGGASSGFWSKLTAKPEGGLKFSNEEWDRFRARLETVVQGIESLLTEGR